MWQGLTSIESIPRVGPQHVGGWLFISGKRVWGAHVAGCCMRDVVHLVHPQEGLIWAQGGKSRTAVTPGEARPEARPLPSRGARKGPGQGSGTSCPTIWYRTCVYVCVCVCLFSCSVVSDAAILWTVALQAPLSMGFSRQDYWSGLQFPPPGNLPDPGTEPVSPVFPALQAYSLPAETSGRPNTA